MEEKKRPAVGATDDLAPPSKRHHGINGSKQPKSDRVDKGNTAEQTEDSWVEKYQKGAIFRQWQETKREKQELGAQVEQLQKHVKSQDDFIRFTESFWDQAFQQLELLADSAAPAPTGPTEPPYITGTTLNDATSFQKYVTEKIESQRKRAKDIIHRIANSRGELTPDIETLEARVNSLLAQQQDYIVQLDRAQHENQQLTENLNEKTLQALKAERRTQRLKSAQVQQLEQQFTAKATVMAQTAERADNANNAEPGESVGEAGEKAHKLKEVNAMLAKQKEHLEAAQVEVQTLREENIALRRPKEKMSEQEFVGTDVFKHLRAQTEDLIKQVNHWQATSQDLRDETDTLQAERTAFRSKLEDETHARIVNLERQVKERDADVHRLRAARDEWFAKTSTLESSSKEEKNAKQQLKELLAAGEDRINALELENQRLKDQPTPDTELDVDTLPGDELLAKYKKLQRDFESINKELPALQQAYTRSVALASGKTMDFSALEDRIATLLAEKQKAEQKYFTARKDADLREIQMTTLRSQIQETSQVVTHLKDAENNGRALISNLEKQLVDGRKAVSTLAVEQRKLEAQKAELVLEKDALSRQLGFLDSTHNTQSAENASLTRRKNELELEVARIAAQADKAQEDLDYWKRRALCNNDEEISMLRQHVLCTICRTHFKDALLTTCGHPFCSNCIDARIASRIRKCPTCGKSFDRLDVTRIHP